MYKDIKEKYLEFKESHPQLPNIDELNKYLDLEFQADDKNYPKEFCLKVIRRSINSLIGNHISFLHGLITPTPSSAISLEEAKFFNEKERNEIAKIISKNMVLFRETSLLEIEKDPEKDIKFLIKNWKKIKNLENTAKKILKKIIKEWKHSEQQQSDSYVL